MAQAAAAATDPSMEDILQSIRRIIAEEDKPDATAEQAEAQLSSDVLELTEMVEEGPPASTFSMSGPADVLANIDEALAAPPPPPPKPTPTPIEVTPMAAPQLGGDLLLSSAAASEAKAALSRIPKPQPAAAAQPGSALPVFRSGTTVEDLIAEEMRPLIKAWLDASLPAMVERIVEREVKRLTNQ